MPELPALAGRFTRLVLSAADWLTSPLAADDYLGLVDPLLRADLPAGRVTEVRRETTAATTLTIRPGRGWGGHRAGQYLPVGVEIDGVIKWRTYSLSSAPGRPDGLLSITVKAVPGGAVSPHLAHRTPPGTLLRLGPAQGEFTLPDPLPPRLLMVTAGSGITPVMGMIRTLDQAGTAPVRMRHPDVVLLHSTPSPADGIFRGELRAAHRRLPWLRLHEHHTRRGSAPSQRLTPASVARLCPDWRERETWACGPAGLLKALDEHWARAGVRDRLRMERFAPAPLRPAAAGASGGSVHFLRSGTVAAADASRPLLDVGESAGVRMPYGCRRGLCRGCLAPLAHGRVRDLRTGEVQSDPGQLIQTCVSAADGDLALDL